jgi:hypothetical protein
VTRDLPYAAAADGMQFGVDDLAFVLCCRKRYSELVHENSLT